MSIVNINVVKSFVFYIKLISDYKIRILWNTKIIEWLCIDMTIKNRNNSSNLFLIRKVIFETQSIYFLRNFFHIYLIRLYLF